MNLNTRPVPTTVTEARSLGREDATLNRQRAFCPASVPTAAREAYLHAYAAAR